jgi:4-amino-4-deoxy-L-arabinose transferase-like glycosyltransferase
MLALGAFNVSYRIADTRIRDWDEAGYGIIAYEMLTQHDFLVTTFGFQRDGWYPKPPLGFWLMAGSFKVCGVGLPGLRLPSMLAAVLTAALLFGVGKRLFQPAVALLAGAILVTTFPFILQHGGRSGDLDAPFTFLMTAAMGILAGRDFIRGRLSWLGLLFALGFLLRSFAILPYAACAVIFLCFFDRGVLNVRSVLLSFAVFVLPIGVWALARYRADGVWFFRQMIEYDFLQRATSTLEESSENPWYYLNFLWDRFAPWGQLLVVAATAGLYSLVRRGIKQPDRRFALLTLWTAVPLLMYSLAATRYHWYINPSLPAMALLAAACAIHGLRLVSSPWGRCIAVTLVGAVLAFNEFRIVRQIVLHESMSDDQRFLISADLPRDAAICGFQPWTQTERFILEAMRVARVHELGSIQDLATVQGPAVFLLRRPTDPETVSLPESPERMVLVNESKDYRLYRRRP